MLKLKEQIKTALQAKSDAKDAHYLAVLEYQKALSELRSLKERCSCGRISHRTFQIYKADSTELRKELERDVVGYKKEVHLAHDRHYQLLAEYVEELRKSRETRNTKSRVECLLSSMCPDDIEALKRHFKS